MITLGRPGTPASIEIDREFLEATHEAYVRHWKKNLSNAKDYREISEQKVIQSGLEGTKLAVSAKFHGDSYRGLLLLVSSGTDHFRISAEAPEGVFDQYETTFQQILDSAEFPGLTHKAQGGAGEPPATSTSDSGERQSRAVTAESQAPASAEDVARLHEKVTREPKNYEAHMDLGDALADSGHLEAAILEYKAALRINKNSPQAHTKMGMAYVFTHRNWKEAEGEFRQALRLRPDDVLGRAFLAKVLVIEAELRQAFNECREVVRIDQKQARDMIFEEFPRLAIEPGVKEDIDRIPADALAHFWIGLQLLELRDYSNGGAELREALRIAPQFSAAKKILVDIQK